MQDATTEYILSARYIETPLIQTHLFNEWTSNSRDLFRSQNHEAKDAFIVCKSPTESRMTEFWSLVKEQNVKTIVSLVDVSMTSSKVSTVNYQHLSCVNTDNANVRNSTFVFPDSLVLTQWYKVQLYVIGKEHSLRYLDIHAKCIMAWHWHTHCIIDQTGSICVQAVCAQDAWKTSRL